MTKFGEESEWLAVEPNERKARRLLQGFIDVKQDEVNEARWNLTMSPRRANLARGRVRFCQQSYPGFD